MIQLESVSYVYPGGHQALDSIDLTISAGEAVAIMGSNGAGKTTLVKHLNGLLKATSGRVLVNGMDTRQAQVSELAHKVGLVFQNPYQQLFAQTVAEEIALGLRNHHWEQTNVGEVVSRVVRQFHLEGLENRHPLSLSEGQKKRLALAAVLATGPEILVLDEPTLGQDGREKSSLRETLEGIHRQGGTIIVVTHDIDFACVCCQRIVILHQGRLVADGPAHEIIRCTDVLHQAGLVPPQLVELAELLAPWGVDHTITSCEELAIAIVEVIRGAKREQRMYSQPAKRVSAPTERPEPISQPLLPPQPSPTGGPISRRDPRSKVAAAAILFMALSLAVRPLPIVLIAISLVSVLFTDHIARPLLRVIGVLLLIVVMVAGMDVIYFGLEHGLLIGFRFLLTVSLFAIFFLTTSLDDLSAALMSWRLPYPLVFALVTGARFAPTVTREAYEIMDAYLARGIDGATGPLPWLRRYARILVPLVAASIRRSLCLGEAMEMRGFGKTNRPTLLRELIWRQGDTILVAIAVVLLVVTVVG